MMKSLRGIFFILTVAVLITYATAIAADSGQRVINPFSDEYKSNASAQVFTNSTASTRKVTVISTFGGGQNQTNSSQAQSNNTAQANTTSQANTTDQQPEEPVVYKVFGAK